MLYNQFKIRRQKVQENEFIQKIKEKIGNQNLTYQITTFGCQLNENDSEKIAGMLEMLGYQKANDGQVADIIVFNTCCVRENAEERLFGKIGEVKNLKQEKNSILAIGGCMMQEQQMVEKIKKSYPYVDIIFGTHTTQNLPENIYKAMLKNEKVSDILDIDGEIYEDLPMKRNSNVVANVTIMYGCNNFCTYCIVPYVRGRERSRKPEKILAEINDLANQGYKEITLLGQNVNSYMRTERENGTVTSEIDSFAKLLYEVAKIEGIEKINFISPHPKDFTDDVIEAIAKLEKISRIIHLPLQSGNSKVLKEMNRKYTKEQYLELVDKMIQKIPNLSLSTDIIVGFPGETDEEFEDTLDVVRKVNFEQIFMFIYSPREGTIAAQRDDQIPEKIKHQRFDKLKELYESKVEENNEKYIGTIHNLLIEGKSKNDSSMFTGRTDTNKVVIFEPKEGYKIGDMVKIKLTENHKWYFKAEIISKNET